MDQEGAARRALGEPLAVVHPGVVAAQVAAADQDEAGGGWCRVAGGEAREVGEVLGGREVDLVIAGGEPVWQPRLERPGIGGGGGRGAGGGGGGPGRAGGGLGDRGGRAGLAAAARAARDRGRGARRAARPRSRA